jgi:RHS repeat-associated protein
MVHQTLANGDIYQAEYVDEERKVHVFSSVGNKNLTYEYGKEMQILSVLYEDGTSEAFNYSEEGYRIWQKDRLGQETDWSYDGTGRIKEEKQKGWLTTVYQYDEAGNLAEKKDNAGRRFTYEYDHNHNLIKAKEKISFADEWFSTSYLYDRKGRLLEETDPLGKTTSYQYNEHEGKPSVITYPDGEEVHFEYDAMGRLMAEEDVCGRQEYGYNARNHRTMVRDGEGNESRYLYDGMGRLLAMYPPKAWKEQKWEYTYQYDFLDRRIDTIWPDGSHERQILDGEGNVLKKIHPNSYVKDMENGEGISYDYDSDGNQIRIHHPDGGCERIFYDANGNRIKHVMPESYDAKKDDGEGWQYTYDDGGHLERVTGPDGSQQVEYTYDLLGNPTRKTDALGRTTWYTYDLKGQLCEIYRPVKEKDQELLYQRTTYAYDANGNKIGEQRLGGYWSLDGQLKEEEGNGLHLKFFYDKRDRLNRVEDGLGAVIRFRYDVQGKRIYEEKTISDGIRQIIHYDYDRAGRLVEKKEELDSGLPAMQGEAKAAITRYCYDENGNRIRIQTPEGYEIFREYDACDRLSSERTLDKQNGIDRIVYVSYDNAGNITKIARQGKGGEVWELDYQYDLKNRIIHVEDCLGPVFRYEYDLNDRLEKEILPKGEQETERENSFQYSYDLYGNLLSKTNGAGIVLEENQYFEDGNISLKRTAEGNELTYQYGIHGLETEVYTSRSRKEGKAAQSYRYDANGRMTGIVDGNQNHTGMDTDSWGRIRSVQNADGGNESYTYNSMGLVTSTTDANGGVIIYRYNSQGKVCEIIDQIGNSETFRYDREGRKVLSVDRNGNQVRTTYNVDGNPVYESGYDAKGKNQVTRSWEYDSFGMKKNAVSGGFSYTYEYRPDGKLIKKSSSGQPLVSCTYDKDGSLRSLTDITGKTLFYGYDWRGNLQNIKDHEGKEIVQYSHWPDGKLKTIRHLNGIKTIYEYDTDGNISRLATFVGDKQPLFDFQYQYDLNGNRTAKIGAKFLPEVGEVKDMTVKYHYDAINRLTEENYDCESNQYLYDLCGNRLEKTSVAGNETYCYNKRNQLIATQAAGKLIEYKYDNQGNMREEVINGKERRFQYNPFGQQVSVEGNGVKSENFYDGELLRAGTCINGKSSRFIFYQKELQAELGEEAILENRFIFGYGVAAAEVKGISGYHGYHLDEQISTAYITEERGKVENHYEYDAFGSIRTKSEEVPNRILYTGQQYDHETEQYYLRARFYNPMIGRFHQEDVYREDGLNLYAYCANNPVVYYDPSGEAGKRQEFMGATLKMNSPGGRQVLDSMYNSGKIDVSGIIDIDIKNSIQESGFYKSKTKLTSDLKKQIKFLSKDDKGWHPLTQGNMSHKNTNGHKDAVLEWNDNLYQYGAKSKEVRDYMKEPANYYIETESANKRDGANIRQSYREPGKKKKDELLNGEKC